MIRTEKKATTTKVTQDKAVFSANRNDSLD